MIRLLPAALLLMTLALPAAGSVAVRTSAPDTDTGFDFGFIASRHRDVNGDWRLKALGPFFEKASNDRDMSMKAFRPVYSRVKDPAHDRQLHDLLWPVGTTRQVEDEAWWRFLVFYGFDHDTDQEDNRYRFWLLPFYFQSRDPSGHTDYALFPVGGTIRDFLGRDSISFALWPLYSTSHLKDISTVNFLWPLISRTTSRDDRIYRARFFPFYGVNRHAGKYDKTFVMWPIYTSVKYYYKHSTGGGHILFPLYGYMNLDTEKTVWVLPPFFRYTKGDERDMLYAPWPFYQRVTGKDYYRHYVWPLWGHRKVEDRERTFYLWPFFWTDKDRRPDTVSSRFLAVPFFSHTVVRSVVPMVEDASRLPVVERRHKFWPLYSYRREGDASRFRFVELWPFAEASAVERNLAPLWSLYTRERNGEHVDTEILWGLYRNQKRAEHGRYWSLFPLVDYRRDTYIDPPVRTWNILKGLIGYERKGADSSLRLLYFLRFGIGKDEQP